MMEEALFPDLARPVIEFLTDEVFVKGYQRHTFRKPTAKYLTMHVGDRVDLRSNKGEHKAVVRSWGRITLPDIAAIGGFPPGSPYRSGIDVVRQLCRVYPDCRLDTQFVSIRLEVL